MIDLQKFENLKDRMGPKFSMLLEGYFKEGDQYINAISGDKMDEVIEASHSLKSASALLGFVKVESTATELEYAAKKSKEENQEIIALEKLVFETKQNYEVIKTAIYKEY